MIDPSIFDLDLHKQFRLKLMEESITGMSPEQMAGLLLEAARLLMLKDQVINSLVKQALGQDK